MLIATFNANSVRARLPIVLAWLAAQQPDILCLQETKVTDADFPVEPFREAGYQAVFRGEKSYNGVALISRQEPASVNFGLDDGGPPDETRLLCARIGAVTVVNTYVPQGREITHAMYAYKLEWFDRLRRYFARHFKPTDPLVWVGDLNVAPEPMDVFDPASHEDHVCYHHAVRDAFARVAAWGFIDVFRKHHPEPGHFTFFDYRTPNTVRRNMGWRVDHILATSPLAKRSEDCFIDLEPRLAEKPSDHTFLAARFAS
ncbi:MAG: exodeoxyribonuclease III [Lentisphaerae bacterium]|nr:exodeoxyribonuclease III [Lentisphaerota bacterium]